MNITTSFYLFFVLFINYIILLKAGDSIRSSRQQDERCPDRFDYHAKSNKCYRDVTKENSIETKFYEDYDKAKSHCEYIGAHLPMVKNMDDLNYFNKDMPIFNGRRYGFINQRRAIWLGAERNADGEFIWSDGTKMDYRFTNFITGQPDNYGGVEDRIQVMDHYYAPQLHKWKDVSKTEKNHVLCHSDPKHKTKPVPKPKLEPVLMRSGGRARKRKKCPKYYNYHARSKRCYLDYKVYREIPCHFYSSAKAVCKMYAGHLPMVKNVDDLNYFLHEMPTQERGCISSSGIWLGAEKNAEGDFVWSDGTKMVWRFTNFVSGQRSNTEGLRDRIQIVDNVHYGFLHSWNKVNEANFGHVLCQADPKPI